MNRFLFLFIFCLLSIFANAYPYRPHTKGAVNAIAHDENNLYVSSFKNGLYIIDKHSGRQTIYCTASGQLMTNDIYSISLHEEAIWLGCEKGWVTTIQNGLPAHEQFTFYSMIDPTDPAHYGIANLAFCENGGFFLSGYYCLMKVKDGDVKDSLWVSSPIWDGSLSHLLMDSKGTLWITCESLSKNVALSSYSPSGEFSYVLQEHADPPTLRTGAQALAIDSEDGIWFTGEKQLFRYADNNFETYPVETIICDMKFRGGNQLWMISQLGKLLCLENGVISNKDCQIETGRGYCIDIDGDDIYLGTDSGLLKYSDGEFTKIELSGSPVGISRLETGAYGSLKAPWYDLQGRPTTAERRGVYIQQGRKIVIK